MAVRRCTAEHPFGTLKSWMGATHFLTRTKDKVNAEMSLYVLAYNIKRMIKILGIKATPGGHSGAWRAFVPLVEGCHRLDLPISTTRRHRERHTHK